MTARSAALRWAFSLILLASAVCLAQTPAGAPSSGEDLGSRIGRAVEQHTLGDWWGEVVVVRDGKTVLAKGFGYANEDLTPMTADSLVDVGDISKQFTAVAVLKLEQEGKLSIDEPVGKFFPDAPDAAKAITLRQILSNTSGLSDRSQLDASIDDMNRDSLVGALLKSPIQHEPGTTMEYCNRAYAIAAAVIEKVSGKSYDEYLREEIFKPAGMTSTGFLDGVGLDRSRRTERMGSLRPGAKKAPLFAPATSGGWSWQRRGTTGAVSCGNDLARWDRVLRADLIINEKERERMREPVQESYGLACILHTTPRNTRRLWHGGSAPGYKTLFVSLLDEGTTIIVITNEMGEPDAIVSVVEDMLFPPLPEHAAATLSVKGVTFDQDEKAYVLKDAVRWVAVPTNDGGVQVSMYRSANGMLIASLTLSEGTAKRLLASLSDVMRFMKEWPDRPTITSIVLAHVAPTPEGLVDFPELNRVELRSSFRERNPDGSEALDRRPTLFVVEPGGTIPLTVRLDKAAAEQLMSAAKAALKK